MNFTNFGFSFSTAVFGPVALKNQTRPSRRVQAAMVRVLSPAMSVLENVVSAVFTGETCEVASFASTGARPICPRHRLMLSASLPPSPGNVTMEMSILPPSSAGALKLAYRIEDGGTSAHPAGVVHLIAGALVVCGGAAAICAAPVLVWASQT